MTRWLRNRVGLLLVISLIWPTTIFAQGEASDFLWSSIKSKPAVERESILLESVVKLDNWEQGTILSRDPFTVVTEYFGSGEEVKAKVRVWTGTLLRSEDDLITSWDDVWFGQDGKVIVCVTDMDYGIEDYFKASSQDQFRTLEYVGKYPWVSIQTDKEAAAAKSAEVPLTGIVNLYGTPMEGDPVIISVPTINELPSLPDQVHAKRIFPTHVLSKLPKDITKHWAKEDIVELMSKGIINGYEDGTIRPNQTLTRAEFITLLLKGLQLTPSGSEISTYSDISKNWAKKAIAQAEQAGIIPKATSIQKFRPDMPITRLEMASWLASALSTLDRHDNGAAISFKDVTSLAIENQNEINKVINNGIMKGYSDGSFRPSNKLTRAEAFVVISRLILL